MFPGLFHLNQSASVATAKKRGRVPLLFQLVIGIGILLFIWFSFGANVLAPGQQRGIPENLGKLPLVSRVEGGDAISQINRLHGTDIKLESAYIASYGHGNERVIVWVGKTTSNDAAAELMAKMLSGIGKGGSGFGNLQQLVVDGQAVLQVEGSGGRHFFYQQANKVVWLTVENTDALPLLRLALKIF